MRIDYMQKKTNKTFSDSWEASIRIRRLRLQCISVKLRKQFIKNFVWSVVSYGSERWTLLKTERLNVFEMWCRTIGR